MRFLRLLLRRRLLALITIIVFIYFILSRVFQKHELDFPSYKLATSNNDFVSTTTEIPHYIKYIPSFFPVSPSHVDRLLKYDGYYAQQLSFETGRNIAQNVSTDSFKCRCGRVSDPCICCGIISSGKSFGHLPIDLYKPIVSPVSQTDAPSTTAFCFNITYLPKKQEANIVGYLINAQQKAEVEGFDWTSFFKASAPLILFTETLSSISSRPELCAENSNNSPLVQLCVLFKSLKYKYDSEEYKTSFVGCAQVSIVLIRKYVVNKFRPVCFDAHRGAIDDVDQANNLLKNKATENGDSKKIENSNHAQKIDPAGAPERPNAESIKGMNVPIGEFDVHRGVP